MDWICAWKGSKSLEQHCIGHQRESVSVEDQRTYGIKPGEKKKNGQRQTEMDDLYCCPTRQWHTGQ